LKNISVAVLETFRKKLSLVSKLRFADGRGAVNPKGLEYYNNLIDELVKNGKVCCTNLCNYNVPTTI
jgi:beta-glucosidase/6-phospho-beta-glucosidase/beta-galactosidase